MPSPDAHPTLRLIDGPDDAPASLLLAHGAGAPMDSPFLAAIAAGLAARGWRVVRFEFPSMARCRRTGRRGAPDRLPTLLESFQTQIHLEAGHGPLFLGGKSLGGRVASLLLAAPDDDGTAADGREAGIRGGFCLGYPFHPPGKPNLLRTAHLSGLQRPLLILQGERDSFGRREEVETYDLNAQITLDWIPSGDHSFKPTRSSGLSEADTWALAVEATDRFCQRILAI